MATNVQHIDSYRTHIQPEPFGGEQIRDARYSLDEDGCLSVTLYGPWDAEAERRLVQNAHERLRLPAFQSHHWTADEFARLTYDNGYGGMTHPHHEDDCPFALTNTLPMRVVPVDGFGLADPPAPTRSETEGDDGE